MAGSLTTEQKARDWSGAGAFSSYFVRPGSTGSWTTVGIFCRLVQQRVYNCGRQRDAAGKQAGLSNGKCPL